MGLFSALKKKKELPELESPPPFEESNEQPSSDNLPQPSLTLYSMELPEQPETPLQAFQEIPVPPDDMQQSQQSQEQSQEQIIHKEALSLFQPQFKFYSSPSEQSAQEEHKEYHKNVTDEVNANQEIPFDVRQELLTLPKEARIPEQKKQMIPRQFLTVSMLLDIGEQLIHMNDDIVLGKDTAFRLSDINEQEIENMAKWHALHQSVELRLAEIDKILFKA